jgi:carbonic anhydrase
MSTSTCHAVRRLFTPLAAATAIAVAAFSAPAAQPLEPAAQAASSEVTARQSVAPRASDPVWHYEGDEGPEHWGTLSPTFITCGKGRAQSPIDIAKTTPVEASAPLKVLFPAPELEIVHHEHVADGINNGHTIQVNYTGADTLTIGNEAYGLVQYHFHNPSEHTVRGKHFPMEMHMVHSRRVARLQSSGSSSSRARTTTPSTRSGTTCRPGRAWRPITSM